MNAILAKRIFAGCLNSNWKRGLALALGCSLVSMNAWAQPGPDRERGGPPTLTVTGRGEASAAADAAVLRLGAVIDDKDASTAQARVNEVMQAALKVLKELNLPKMNIKTAGLSLQPVYDHQERPIANTRPRLIGYRAHNTLQIEIGDLTQVGRVIDAAVTTGANQVESLSFQLKDDQQARKRALIGAVEEARAKAEVIAETMGIRIRGVREVIEGGVHVIQPRMELAQARFAPNQSTPVEPGDVKVEAAVTVHYSLEEPTRGNQRER